jgi:pyrroloquinoline quinone biosynthesis protein E
VRNASLRSIWHESKAFNAFRGFDWMKEPCRACPERFKDFGGCRCQAYLLSGDAANTDPVCALSPHHDAVTGAIEQPHRAATSGAAPYFRDDRNSRWLSSRR